ncbi:hypothetical protein ACFQJ5_16735 [Halomicroarcula sp. GCM10025324]|uniref:hypothetical protein n=1 Tax=Haloarcula TaxID=2237 RepID=UPI0023E7DBFC|nr:hypothetical protein [Halomicroarcula sp. ZS-22-S1]
MSNTDTEPSNDQLATDGGIDQDVEEIGVEAGAGESWAQAAGRLRDRDDDRWHYCICGARYRSRGAALRCCGDRFDDLDDGGAGQAVSDGGQDVVYYAVGNYDVYHERRDCHYLRRADSVRELVVSTMNGTREPCGGCVDTVDGPDGDGRLVADGGQCPSGTDLPDECPNCGSRKIQGHPSRAPRSLGQMWCPDCEREIWKEASGWWMCGFDGEVVSV